MRISKELYVKWVNYLTGSGDFSLSSAKDAISETLDRIPASYDIHNRIDRSVVTGGWDYYIVATDEEGFYQYYRIKKKIPPKISFFKKLKDKIAKCLKK